VTQGAAAGESGIPHGALVIEFAEALLAGDPARLERARRAIVQAVGAAALVDCAAVAGLFNAIDRVADATGAPLDAQMAADTEAMRAELGIDDFAAAKARLE